MEYRAEELNDSNASDWDHLNNTATDGGFCQGLKWKRVLERTFGYSPCYFLIYRDRKPVALCPFYKAKIKWFSGLITLPNSIYDHVIVSDKQDPRITRSMHDRIRELLRKERLSFATIGLTAEMKDYFLGLPVSTPYSTGGNHVLNLQGNSIDNIWNSLFAKHQRQKIRRFDKDGFTADKVDSTEDLDIFFRYYAKNMDRKNFDRKLPGEKPYPPECKFEREIIRSYKDEVVVVMLRRKDEIAGGAFFLLFRPGRKMYFRVFWPNRDLPNAYSSWWYLSWFGVKLAYDLGFSSLCFGDTPDNPNNVNYVNKAKFGAQFQRRYGAIFSEDGIFNLAYKGLRFAQQHKLVSHISRSGHPGD
jgi:hypothetical protein